MEYLVWVFLVTLYFLTLIGLTLNFYEFVKGLLRTSPSREQKYSQPSQSSVPPARSTICENASRVKIGSAEPHVTVRITVEENSTVTSKKIARKHRGLNLPSSR